MEYQNLPGSSIRTILLNGSYQGLANLYYLVVRAIYVIIFARLVGVELYGYYSYANNWYVMWLPVATWGMHELVISQYARTDPAQQDTLTGTGLGLRLLFSGAMAVVVALAARGLEPDPQLQLLITIYSQGIVARGISTWFCALFIARERSIYWLCIAIPCLTLEVVLALALAYRGAGLVAIAIAQCMVWWLTAALAWVVYRRAFDRVAPQLDARLVRFYLYNGAALALAAFILGCLGPGLLVVYRYLITDLERLGEIAFVLQVFAILSQITRVVSNSALPALSRDVGAGNRRLATFAASICKQSLYFGGAMFLVCYWLLEPVVARVIGEDFAPAAGLFARHSWLLVPLLMMHGLRLILITERQQHLFLLAILAGLSVLGIQVVFHASAGRLGGELLVVSLGVAYTVIAGMLVTFIRTERGKFAARSIVLPLFAVAGCLIASLFVAKLSPVLAAIAGGLPLLAASGLAFRAAQRELDGVVKGVAAR